MKLILRDYIQTFKEDGELDSLLVNLLFHMNIEPVSRPKKGRQFGVDIMGVGIDPDDSIKKVYLLSVKRGDLKRSNWNSGVNAIKPSLEEIIDDYIPTLIPKELKKMPIKIVFALNGVIEQPALVNWTNFTNKHNKRRLKIECWDIDRISLLAEQYLFNESLLPKNTWILLRKALAFIDVGAYDLSHVSLLFERILFESKEGKLRKLDKYKKVNLVNICTNLIFGWAKEQDYLRNSVFAAEKAMLFSWKYISERAGVVDKKLLEQYAGTARTLYDIQHAYLEKTAKFCAVRDSLTRATKSNHVEYSLICYEYLGILSTIGLHYHHLKESLGSEELLRENKENFRQTSRMVEEISTALCLFIKNNPGSYYPSYDSHAIEVCLVNLFLFKAGKLDELRDWMHQLCSTIQLTYKTTSFFPLFNENYDKLVDAKVNAKMQPPESSILITVLAEWCVVGGWFDLYANLRIFKERELPTLDLQLWYPDEKIEKVLFTENADREYGKTKYGITLYKDPNEYKKEMNYELNDARFSPEPKLNFFQGKFHFLGLLASRHYRTMVFPYYWRSLI